MAICLNPTTKKKGVLAIAAKDWLLVLWLSSLGWIWEMVYGFLFFSRFSNSGFLHLPICPIYGFTIIVFFYLIGTPHRGRYALKRIKSVFWRYAVYASFAFLLPSLVEFGVGALYNEVWGVRLWNYSAQPLNVGGYVSLPISLAWTVALTLFMRIFFLPMRTFFQSARTKPAVITAVISAVAVATDFIYGLVLLILR